MRQNRTLKQHGWLQCCYEGFRIISTAKSTLKLFPLTHRIFYFKEKKKSNWSSNRYLQVVTSFKFFQSFSCEA